MKGGERKGDREGKDGKRDGGGKEGVGRVLNV